MSPFVAKHPCMLMFLCFVSVLQEKAEMPLPVSLGSPKIQIQPCFLILLPTTSLSAFSSLCGYHFLCFWVFAPTGFFPQNSHLYYNYFPTPPFCWNAASFQSLPPSFSWSHLSLPETCWTLSLCQLLGTFLPLNNIIFVFYPLVDCEYRGLEQHPPPWKWPYTVIYKSLLYEWVGEWGNASD